MGIEIATGPFFLEVNLSFLFLGLPLDCVADVFDCLAYFALGLTPALLQVAACAVGATLISQLSIVDCLANVFFDPTLGLIKFSFYLISVW